MQTISQISSAQTLDVSLLTEGLHTVHLQVVDNEDHVSYVKSSVFVKVDNHSEVSSVRSIRYWFDDEANNVSIAASSGTHNIDASMLHDGLHTIHYQVMGHDGSAYYVASAIFVKMSANAAEAVSPKQLLYWFDDETAIQNIDVSGGLQILDVSGLTEGLHTIHYLVLCSNGQMTPAMSSLFMRMNDGSEATFAKSLRYWFDDDATTVKVDNISNGSRTLDVSALTAGLHTLNYQLIDSEGKVGVPVARLFFKDFEKAVADGENRITKYQYWLNKNSQTMQTVELANASNPYQLISLLPVHKEPIHSDLFHFEITDDVPTVYAKNTFHVRFWDARGYLSDGDKAFIDYSVKHEVEPVGELQTTQMFDKVAANDILWYTMQAALGDTAAFRVSQPATVQVFTPSGKEVFNTSGSESVNWGGIHTWEDGTYYLAVHDVTGSQNTMTLDYMHMDKYDVVDWDVHRVGNGGCSTITFKGNGFRDLYAVDLVIAPGDTIHSVDVSYISDAKTTVTFNFTTATLGEYDALFHFTEQNKIFSNVVTVEEAVDIELATEVSFPSTFLSGTSTTYTVKITNKGNMTAYAVPLEIRMQMSDLYQIKNIKLGEGLSDQTDFIGLMIDSLEQEVNEVLGEYATNMSDYSQFLCYHDSIQHKDYAVSQVIVSIPPQATKFFSITIQAKDPVLLETFVAKEWLPLCLSKSSVVKRQTINTHNTKFHDWMCCQREKIECAADLITAVISRRVCQNRHILFFYRKAPTFSSQGFVMS